MENKIECLNCGSSIELSQAQTEAAGSGRAHLACMDCGTLLAVTKVAGQMETSSVGRWSDDVRPLEAMIARLRLPNVSRTGAIQ